MRLKVLIKLLTHIGDLLGLVEETGTAQIGRRYVQRAQTGQVVRQLGQEQRRIGVAVERGDLFAVGHIQMPQTREAQYIGQIECHVADTQICHDQMCQRWRHMQQAVQTTNSLCFRHAANEKLLGHPVSG